MSMQRSVGLPDVHSGYGFAIGNMAAFDTSDPQAVVSPGMYVLSLQIVVSCLFVGVFQFRSYYDHLELFFTTGVLYVDSQWDTSAHPTCLFTNMTM